MRWFRVKAELASDVIESSVWLDAAVGLDVVVPPGRRGRPRGDPRSGLRGASGLPDTTGGFHGNANLEPYRIIGPDGPLAADLDAIRFCSEQNFFSDMI